MPRGHGDVVAESDGHEDASGGDDDSGQSMMVVTMMMIMMLLLMVLILEERGFGCHHHNDVQTERSYCEDVSCCCGDAAGRGEGLESERECSHQWSY